MNILWLYRVFTLVLVCIASLVVIALCAHTSSNLDKILSLVGLAGSFPYTTLGITVGAISIVSNALLIFLDFIFDTIFTSMLVFEIAWFSILWILWISVGATTLSEGNRIFSPYSCDDFSRAFDVPKSLSNICEDIHPIVIVAFVNFALLFLYTAVLLFVAFTSSGSTPAWTTSIKNRNK
ncbi:hypothetical protein C8Q78DRAFT_969908 [Trametes maxima]|nr:hypothetical protein C8Q78DRAFT_969908 [Trametes maxima]